MIGRVTHAVVAATLGAIGCVHAAPEPQVRYWVTSDSSQYSPVARFRVAAAIAGSSVRIVLDSGSVYAPGVLTPQSPPMMNQLYLTAYVAVPNAAPTAFATEDAARRADRRNWRAIAMSDSILVIDQLRFGERRSIDELRIIVPHVTVSSQQSAWLVLRIAGNALEFVAPIGTGSPPRSRERPGGVHVYACGDRDLQGHLDTARSNALKQAYQSSC